MALPPVVILCGGRGTRLRQRAAGVPKPLVEIGGRPILWHVMQLYRVQGATRFWLCAGYKAELIAEFARGTDWGDGVEVTCVDTGLDTPTGGRINRMREHVGEATFMATYADGVADVDLPALLAHHRGHGAAATVTLVRPQLPFGVALLDDATDRVAGFAEKPRSEHWVNGGFFCFEPRVFDYLSDAAVLEREPLEGLAGDGALRGFRHTGFWECMDTYKDATQLNDLWDGGRAPWKLWT